MLHLRPATTDDAGLLETMIRELAVFENFPESAKLTKEDLIRDGFGQNPLFRALIAEWEGEAAGYALFFEYYSSWRGRGLYLEDLFVREAYRKRGIGKSLLAKVARIAVDEQCEGIHWEVLDWNTKAIAMYKASGAEFLDGWRRVLLTGEALERVANGV